MITNILSPVKGVKSLNSFVEEFVRFLQIMIIRVAEIVNFLKNFPNCFILGNLFITASHRSRTTAFIHTLFTSGWRYRIHIKIFKGCSKASQKKIRQNHMSKYEKLQKKLGKHHLNESTAILELSLNWYKEKVSEFTTGIRTGCYIVRNVTIK